MILFDSAHSRELDRLSQTKYGIASYALMTRAGEEVALALARRWPDALGAGVLVVAGKGNNGGDGFVAARRLFRSGATVRVVLLAAVADLRGDAARACSDFLADGGEVRQVAGERELADAFKPPPASIVDAIFGTGLNAPVSGLPLAAIERINAMQASVLSVDIASGVDADTGAIMGAAVNATLTVTFGYAKYGHVSYPGAARCGELELVDIGFAAEAIDEIKPAGRYVESTEVQQLVRPRANDSHKGNYGHALIVAASRGKAGAAVLAARAALRTGAGLVTAAIPQCVGKVVAAGQAELMTEPLPDRDGHFDSAAIDPIRTLADGKDALCFGPGVGVSDGSKAILDLLLREIAAPHRPLVVDADGLNLLASAGCERAREARGPILLTPHPGEMARLLGSTTTQVNANRIASARRLVDRAGAFVLLKGARSVLAAPDGRVFVNSTGNPGMGTPGMGDVLSGMLVALLGQGMEPFDALTLGVFIHGAAADRLADRIAPVGFLAGDLIDEIPVTIAQLGPGAGRRRRF